MFGPGRAPEGAGRAEGAPAAGDGALRAFADALPHLAWVARPDGAPELFSARFLAYVGRSEEEALAASLASFLHPEDAVGWCAAWRDALARGEEPRVEVRVRRSDGASRWHLLQAAPSRSEAGEVVRWWGTGVDIHEHVQARRAEAERARRARALELAPIGVAFLDGGGELCDANEAFCRLVGVNREDVRGGRYSWRQATPPEYGPRDAQAAAQARARGAHEPYEKELLRPDGRRVPVLVGGGALTGGAAPADAEGPWEVRFTLDLTTQRRAEEALRLNEERFRTALAQSMVLVFNQDRALRYTWFHSPFRDFSGESVLGKRDVEVVGEDAGRQLEELKRAVLESGVQERRLMRLTIAGKERYLEMTLQPLLDIDGRPIGITGAALDTTDRIRLEEQLRAQAELLREADRRKDTFLAALAHELRNPLAPIRSAVELLRLRGAPRDPTVRWAREVIERQVRSMARLLDDLLDVARITRDRIELRRGPVRLDEVVSHAVETSSPVLAERRHRLTVSVPSPALWLEADATRLEQVLTNLLTNAARYTPEGGQVWLAVREEHDQAVISVRDTGRGIPADVLPHVFEPFMQAERGLDRVEGGLGLGLTLVERLVTMHGGQVDAYSEGPGRGSEFRVRLPLCPKARERPAPVAPAERRPRRVLVVEDNTDAAETLAALLSASGHEVRVAFDGPRALTEAASFQPEIVLLDIGLPGMDGYEVARRLREEPPGADSARLVALTGYGQEEDRRRAQEAGFDSHLLKPVDFDRLEDLLAEL